MSSALRVVSRSPGQTRFIGRVLGRLLQPHDVLALAGPLGAGKTQLVKGLARGLHVPAGESVVSPTFVLVREYVGRLRLYHIDAYRLTDPRELIALGFDEMLSDPGAALVIEWADRVKSAIPASAWWIRLEHDGPSGQGATGDTNVRRLCFELPDEPRAEALRQALARLGD